jgi:AraC-like DNA-binding protein
MYPEPSNSSLFRDRTIICILFILILHVFSSCSDSNPHGSNSEPEKTWAVLLDTAALHTLDDPARTIRLSDSALSVVASGGMSDTSIFRPLELKTDAILAMGYGDSAMRLLDSARLLAMEFGESPLLARIMLKTAKGRFVQEDMRLAEQHIAEAVRLFRKLKMDKEYAISLKAAGDISRRKGDLTGAQKFLLEALRILEKQDDHLSLAFAYLEVGNLFSDIGNKNDAFLYYRKGVDAYAKMGDSSQMAPAFRNLGLIKRQSDPDSAIFYYTLANRLDPGIKNPKSYIIGLYNTANIHLDRQDFPRAKAMFDTVYTFCEKKQIFSGMARVKNAYGILAMQKGENVVADKHFRGAIAMAESIGEKALVMNFTKSYSEFKESIGQLGEALSLERKFRKLNDSIMSSDGKLEILRMEKEFQSQKKDIENNSLRAENARLLAYDRMRNILVWLSVAAAIVLSVLLNYARRIQREKAFAYEVLMQRYQTERDLRQVESEISRTPDIIHKRFFIKRDEQELLDAIIGLFTQKKPYLDSNLKISDVAEQLNTTTRNITNVLKGYKASKFSEFVNIFRVEEVKRRMENLQYDNMTIEAIARDSGFGTKQSFYNTFEAVTGVKPAHYRTHILITDKVNS